MPWQQFSTYSRVIQLCFDLDNRLESLVCQQQLWSQLGFIFLFVWNCLSRCGENVDYKLKLHSGKVAYIGMYTIFLPFFIFLFVWNRLSGKNPKKATKVFFSFLFFSQSYLVFWIICLKICYSFLAIGNYLFPQFIGY